MHSHCDNASHTVNDELCNRVCSRHVLSLIRNLRKCPAAAVFIRCSASVYADFQRLLHRPCTTFSISAHFFTIFCAFNYDFSISLQSFPIFIINRLTSMNSISILFSFCAVCLPFLSISFSFLDCLPVCRSIVTWLQFRWPIQLNLNIQTKHFLFNR